MGASSSKATNVGSRSNTTTTQQQLQVHEPEHIRPPEPCSTCQVFISHAGEQKATVASPLNTLLTSAGRVTTFFDIKSLPDMPGMPNAPEMNSQAAHAPVVVAILSRDYVCKKWPMLELKIVLDRVHQQLEPQGQKRSFWLVPMLHDITIEELKDLQGTVYIKDSTWERREKPSAEVLQHWAELGRRVTQLNCTTPKEVAAACLGGDILTLVLRRCIDALKKLGLLPPGYMLSGTHLLPMFLNRPSGELVGRKAELEAISAGLLEKKQVLITGAPGEGKSMLARTAGIQLYDEGRFPGGAFEVDCANLGAIVDDQDGVVPRLAYRLVPALKRVLGNPLALDAPATWDSLDSWLRTNREPWLLLLDNAEELLHQPHNPKHGLDPLSELCNTLVAASTGQLHIMVTSRVSMLMLEHAAVIHLEAMCTDEAAELLCSLVDQPGTAQGTPLSHDDIADISKACGYNALLLNMVGGLMKSRRITPQDVLKAPRAAKVMDGHVLDPIKRQVQQLAAWWQELLGSVLSEQELLVAAGLAVFAGSFRTDAAGFVAARMTKNSMVSTRDVKLLLSDLQDLCVLQDASLSTGLQGRYMMHHLHKEAAAELLKRMNRPDLLKENKWALVRSLVELFGQVEAAHASMQPALLKSTSLLLAAEAANMSELLAMYPVRSDNWVSTLTAKEKATAAAVARMLFMLALNITSVMFALGKHDGELSQQQWQVQFGTAEQLMRTALYYAKGSQGCTARGEGGKVVTAPHVAEVMAELALLLHKKSRATSSCTDNDEASSGTDDDEASSGTDDDEARSLCYEAVKIMQAELHTAGKVVSRARALYGRFWGVCSEADQQRALGMVVCMAKLVPQLVWYRDFPTALEMQRGALGIAEQLYGPHDTKVIKLREDLELVERTTRDWWSGLPSYEAHDWLIHHSSLTSM